MSNTTFHSITLPGCAPAYAPEVAFEFNTTTNYAVGDYCTYQGNLYKCTAAHASASWDIGHFEQTNITNEIKFKQDISFSSSAKYALLALLEKVAYIDANGQDYLDTLEEELFKVKVESITAVYTQSGAVYTDDSLDDLRSGLVVTASYSDGTTETVTTYALSGSLTSGTSTITVSYGGKTTTFTVTVTAPLYSIPDFAAQTITASGKSVTVKKENGVYTISGKFSDVVYIYPDGAVHNSKSNTLWFATAADKPLLNQAIDVSWSNPGSVATQFQSKFAQSDATGNLASATVTMAVNSSGLEVLAEFTNDAYPARNFSCLAFQISGGRSYSASVSCKIRLFSDGVRLL